MFNARIGLLLLLCNAATFAQKPARINILLPERTRLPVRQRIDLVIEARNVTTAAHLKVTVNDQDISDRFSAPVSTELDCDGTAGTVFRADRFEFEWPGEARLAVELQSSGETLRDARTLEIKPFTLPEKPRNYVIFIG